MIISIFDVISLPKIPSGINRKIMSSKIPLSPSLTPPPLSHTKTADRHTICCSYYLLSIRRPRGMLLSIPLKRSDPLRHIIRFIHGGAGYGHFDAGGFDAFDVVK